MHLKREGQESSFEMGIEEGTRKGLGPRSLEINYYRREPENKED